MSQEDEQELIEINPIDLQPGDLIVLENASLKRTTKSARNSMMSYPFLVIQRLGVKNERIR